VVSAALSHGTARHDDELIGRPMLEHAYALWRVVAVRRVRPPKRPRRPALRPLPFAISLPAILRYYIAASYTHRPVLIGLPGLAALCHVDELVVWWRWRTWSA
jgi:hypothetical protein